jgi:hypothetical protein
MTLLGLLSLCGSAGTSANAQNKAMVFPTMAPSLVVPLLLRADLNYWRDPCVQTQGVPMGRRHINLLDLETVLLVLTHFVSTLRGHCVLVWSDNRTTVSYINRQRGVRSPALHRLAEELWLWATKHLSSLSAAHIPGYQNVGADLISRGGPRDDECHLHPYIVLQIWERFARAEVDLFTLHMDWQCESGSLFEPRTNRH